MVEPAGSRIVVPVQVLRAVAAIAVLVLHISFDLSHFGGMPGVLPEFALGAAGVDLFFVISGFVMIYASERLFSQANGPLIFLTHRLIRIVPLYWLMTTFYLALTLTVPAFWRSWPPGTVAASYAFIPVARPDGVMEPIVGQGWTLNYEMFFYVIFALAVFAPRRTAAVIASLVLIAVVVLGRLVTLPPGPLSYWSDPIILEFVFGMLIGLCRSEGMRLARPVALALIGAGIVLLFGGWFSGFPSRVVAWGVPAALVVAGSALGRFSAAGAFWQPLIVMGDASYALYLVHPTPVRALISATRATGVDIARHPWLYFSVSFVAAIGAALGLHYLFERPFTAFLRHSIGFGRPVRPAAVP